ncbi:MAG: MgtC/SapB family protein [Chloroflexi bacterium]|uniref:MgtC/SapB family protein n=1 Tax=Candidatus Chlorohelix allophototropha TaxID=3003348 RepID=A0A8T7LYJ3_9CHLR|nr:MgtC/SapB family protein [Chloroflexota bacterium]WJW66312.1 MgtC/SapB family protein [Chloroflexota bacterium L227-S17]
MDLKFLEGLPLDIQMTFRLVIAYLLSAFIGWEREQTHVPAGLRTHILVGLGSTAFMLVSLYGFNNLGTVGDPARVAAQIITGIGFLGAGTIWRNESRVGGLTTAASIWVTAAVGMLAGVGMLVMATVVAFMGWFTLRVLRPVERKVQNGNNSNKIPNKSGHDKEL